MATIASEVSEKSCALGVAAEELEQHGGGRQEQGDGRAKLEIYSGNVENHSRDNQTLNKLQCVSVNSDHSGPVTWVNFNNVVYNIDDDELLNCFKSFWRLIIYKDNVNTDKLYSKGADIILEPLKMGNLQSSSEGKTKTHRSLLKAKKSPVKELFKYQNITGRKTQQLQQKAVLEGTLECQPSLSVGGGDSSSVVRGNDLDLPSTTSFISAVDSEAVSTTEEKKQQQTLDIEESSSGESVFTDPQLTPLYSLESYYSDVKECDNQHQTDEDQQSLDDTSKIRKFSEEEPDDVTLTMGSDDEDSTPMAKQKRSQAHSLDALDEEDTAESSSQGKTKSLDAMLDDGKEHQSLVTQPTKMSSSFTVVRHKKVELASTKLSDQCLVTSGGSTMLALLWCCLLAASLSSAAVSFASVDAADALSKPRDVNKTITRVEAILTKNPSLPRLTRGEILALLDNITKTDAEKKKRQELLNTMMNEKTRAEYERALLVVLPFKANDSMNTGGLEELYTRMPVTKYVSEEPTTKQTRPLLITEPTTTKRPTKRKNGSHRKPTESQEQRLVFVQKSRRRTTTTTTTTTTPKPPTLADYLWKPYVTVATVSSSPSSLKLDALDIPQDMRDTLNDFGITGEKTTTPVIFATPIRNTNVFYTQKPARPLRPLRKTTTTTTTTVPPPTTRRTTTTTKPVTTTSTMLPDLSVAVQSLTPEMKNLLISFGLLNPDGSPVNPKAVTTTEAPPEVFHYKPIGPTVDPSSYVSFKPLPVVSSYGQQNNDVVNNDMKSFLASFGLIADPIQNFRSQKALNTSSITFNETTTTTPNVTTAEPSVTTAEPAINEKKSLPEINTDILTDDMKRVLENLGLMKETPRKSKGHIFNPAAHTADLLNQAQEAEKISKLIGSIKEISEAEKNKTLSAEESLARLENITATLIAEEGNGTLYEELTDEPESVEGEGTELSFEGYEPAEEELLKLQNGIVDDDLNVESVQSDPTLDVSADENEVDANKDADEEAEKDIKTDHKVVSKNLQNMPHPPDPLSLEELEQLDEANKNEVKRQQPNGTEDTTTTTTESSAESDSSSDTSVRGSSSADDSVGEAQSDPGASISDLEDSFGGETPPSRPNGLYFLVDWNTFLRVGTDNRTVNLNFSPKVGDPRNFLPVTVP